MLRFVRKHLVFILPLATLILSGCMSSAQGPAEFRESHDTWSDREHFVVQRDYQKVSQILQKKAKECFGTYKGDTYRANVRLGDGRTELYLQVHEEGGMYHLNKEPAGGYYVTVVDVTNTGHNLTSVDMYKGMVRYRDVNERIEQWIRGTSVACPQYTH